MSPSWGCREVAMSPSWFVQGGGAVGPCFTAGPAKPRTGVCRTVRGFLFTQLKLARRTPVRWNFRKIPRGPRRKTRFQQNDHSLSGSFCFQSPPPSRERATEAQQPSRPSRARTRAQKNGIAPGRLGVWTFGRAGAGLCRLRRPLPAPETHGHGRGLRQQRRSRPTWSRKPGRPCICDLRALWENAAGPPPASGRTRPGAATEAGSGNRGPQKSPHARSASSSTAVRAIETSNEPAQPIRLL